VVDVIDEDLAAGVLGTVSDAVVAIDDGNVDFLLHVRECSVKEMVVDGWVVWRGLIIGTEVSTGPESDGIVAPWRCAR
jgi:hypothetical protein